MKHTVTTYTIDNCHSTITKEGKNYKVDTVRFDMPEIYANDSAVSNVAYFSTIKQCKQHVDKISTII